VNRPPSFPRPASDLGAPHRLILVRHGQTAHTVAQRISGAGFRPEPELDEVGGQQARSAARRLAQLEGRIDEALASPMLRAGQTARAILDHLDLPVAITSPNWSEADFGDWEGMTVAEVMARYPGAWETMIGDPELGPPRGESLADVRRRVLAAWREVVVPARTTLVVTHLTPIRIVVAEALGAPHEAFGRVIAAPGSITVVDRWADGGSVVVAVGERPQLQS